MHDMKPIRQTMAAALLAACCATTFAAGQAGAPRQDGAPPADQGPGGGPGMDGPMGRGLDGGPARGQGFGDPRGHGVGHGGHHGLGHLGGLRLSEAQQDKLFAIEHAAAPQRRQQEKAVRRAHEALRALRDAAQFDDARAAAASRELGQAIAAEALLEARLHAQAMAVLTPEQREQLRQRRAQPSP
jgi:Spy/CpxP family protein refolding chaperone